jgi:hypothetical protein
LNTFKKRDVKFTRNINIVHKYWNETADTVMVGKWSAEGTMDITHKVLSAVFIFNRFYKCKHILKPFLLK